MSAYAPRHLGGTPVAELASAAARRRHDLERAERAVLVLAATDDLPASRLLYRELLLSGALLGHADVWAVARFTWPAAS